MQTVDVKWKYAAIFLGIGIVAQAAWWINRYPEAVGLPARLPAR